jgi:hypothetical protein
MKKLIVNQVLLRKAVLPKELHEIHAAFEEAKIEYRR